MNSFMEPWSGQRDVALRQAIYQGAVLRMPASAASRALVDKAWQTISGALGGDPRKAATLLDGKELFRQVGQLRRALYLSRELRQSIKDLLLELEADPAVHVCDPARLRAVTPGGHRHPAAAPVYYAHRDTWYSNPQTQITWWMPLHPVGTEETFEFLPDYFDQPVENDSSGFDYSRWTKRGKELQIGWQDPDAGIRESYPRLREPLPSARRISFAAEPGEVIVFSGQHLHQTLPIEVGGTRFSIDFRTVHLGDHQDGVGPRNVDNGSTGDALSGHVPLVEQALGNRSSSQIVVGRQPTGERRFETGTMKSE